MHEKFNYYAFSPVAYRDEYRKPVLVSIAVIFIASLLFGGTGTGLREFPDPGRFPDLFFAEPFVVLIFMSVIWFTTLIKSDASRLNETRFLNSLPVDKKSIINHLLIRDCLTHSWFPMIILVLFISLTEVSAIPYLCRTAVFLLLFYIFVLTINAFLHLTISLKAKNGGGVGYPVKNNLYLTLGLILIFDTVLLLTVIVPAVISGYTFWLVLIFLSLSGYFLIVRTQNTFREWVDRNCIYITSRTDSGAAGSSAVRKVFTGKYTELIPPLVVKNYLKILRGRNIPVIILSVIFLFASYLVSLNNDSMEDSANVLYFIYAIFSFIYIYYSTRHLFPENEPVDFIYSIPVRKKDLYLSAVTPSGVWLFLVMLFLTLLILFSGDNLTIPAVFFLKTLIITTVFLFSVFNLTIAYYPEIKTARRYNLYAVFVFCLFSVIFYKYIYIVWLVYILVSFLYLRKTKFYRTSKV
ncbi:hypothetical protein ACFL6G_06795 [candidate division KSB1 bacterium]